MSDKTQLYADLGLTRAFFEALKAIYGPSYQTQAPLLSADRATFHTDKESIMTHWTEHFGGLFSDQHKVADSSIENIPVVEPKHELDEPPTVEEIKTAIRQMKPGKSPGSQPGWLGRLWSASCRICSPFAGNRAFYRRTLSMQSSSRYKKTRVRNQTAQITVALHFCP